MSGCKRRTSCLTGLISLRRALTPRSWKKVVRKLRAGQMPPEGRPRPDADTIDRFVTALEATLDQEAAADPNPGRVASRRMNRVEYVHAV